MERDTVLVVGAGASHGARIGHPRPPLGAGLPKYLLRWFDENAPRAGDDERCAAMANPFDASTPARRLFDYPDVRPVLEQAATRAEASDTAFEEIMAELLAQGDRTTLVRVNEIIAASFLGGVSCPFDAKRDLYDELFARLGGRLRTIITPNYDLLCEEALERQGHSYWYRGVQPHGSEDVGFDKLHGSANWFRPSGVGGSARLEVARQNARPLRAVPQTWMASFFNDHPLDVHRGRTDAFLQIKHDSSPPVLVTYAHGKDAMDSRPSLDQVRAASFAALRATPPTRVLAIGIRPPRGEGDDDTWQNLCELLAGLPSQKQYWSTVPDERDAMQNYDFEPRDGYFDAFVAAQG